MKIKFLSIATVVALFIASCGGVDKGLVDSITKFETDWTSLVKNITAASEKMATTSAETIKECDEVCAMECKDKKMQASMDSCKMACTSAKDGMTSTMANCNTMKDEVAKMTTEFNIWKEKVMKGEVKGEEATKALETYKTALTEKTENLKALNDMFDRSMSDCKSTCSTQKDCCEKK